jgi:asparagine synthase (glutamine-hydrolysing)
LAVVENGRVETRKYWDVRYTAQETAPAGRSQESWADEIYERLRASVRRRLISDVPLGVFLSGGIDSSAVTALMAETSSGPVKSFSIGFKEKSFDELPWAKIVAERFKTEHTEFVVGPEKVRELVPILARSLDEPLADASCIPTYIISKLARRHVTVALAGDGGDELFAGYDTHKAYRLARIYRRAPAFLRRGLIRPVVRRLPASKKRLSFEFKAKKFISGAEHPPEIANFLWWGAYTPQEKTRLFAPDLRAALAGENLFGPVEFWQATAPAGETLDRICYLDLKLYLQDDLLVKVDRMSMANSLEIRAPFLDYTFVEFAATIPSGLKLKGSTSKYILKKMLRRLLPEEILTKKKIGFDIPLGDWMQTSLKDFTLDMLSEAQLKRQGLFDPAYIGRILQEHLRGRHNHRQLLWPLVIFQSWRDAYLA